MRPSIFTIFILCAYLFLPGCSGDKQLKPLKPISVATGEWEPYVGENLPNYGPLAEMMSAILADLGYVPVFKFYSWGIVETHLQSGYPAIAFPYLKTEERVNKKFQYSDPIINLDWVLFYYKGNVQAGQITSLDQIKNRKSRIGRIKGYSKLPQIQADSFYVELASATEGFNALLSGRIDYLLEAKLVGLRMLESEQIPTDRDSFLYLGQSKSPGLPDDSALVRDLNFHILLSPKIPNQFVTELNHAINDSLNAEFFASLKEKIKSAADDKTTAYLSDNENNIIYGYTDEAGNNSMHFMLPQNTSVLVISWNKAYKEPLLTGDLVKSSARSKVKILNGPLKGKVLWVSGKNINLNINTTE